MKARIIIVAIFIILHSACYANEEKDTKLINSIENNLETYLFSKYKEFQITEIFTKNENKKLFFKKSLGSGIIDGAIDIKYKELYFKELTDKYESHIGIASIKYPNEEISLKAFNLFDKKGFFGNTKILTKYLLLHTNEVNLVIYSESVSDKNISIFMADILKKYAM